jgi:hypothetical protein
MANLTKGGFRVWGTISGGEGVLPGMKTAEVASNYGTAIFRGDILTAVSDGTVAASAAADNGKLIGVANGFSYVISNRREPMPCLPANTTFTPSTVGSPNASYVDYFPLTPDLILEVDGNAAAPTPTVAGVIGLIQENCDLATGTGDLTTGVSAMTLDLSTHATTTFNFRVIGVTEYPHFTNNDVTLSHCKFLVVCNEGILPSYTPTGI